MEEGCKDTIFASPAPTRHLLPRMAQSTPAGKSHKAGRDLLLFMSSDPTFFLTYEKSKIVCKKRYRNKFSFSPRFHGWLLPTLSKGVF
jgi:hypothetical protein